MQKDTSHTNSQENKVFSKDIGVYTFLVTKPKFTLMRNFKFWAQKVPGRTFLGGFTVGRTSVPNFNQILSFKLFRSTSELISAVGQHATLSIKG